VTTQNTPSTAAGPALDQVEIFRPGRHTAMSGQVIEFTATDVAAIAAAYDPAVHEAPHVVGHPTTDGPAYGWVGALAVNASGRLVVSSSRQVEPQFAELVNTGRFKKRSASFYPPSHPGNPKPGGYYLKHVGWLGATPPSIKGLADVASYGEPEAGLVSFMDWDDMTVATIFGRLREWLLVQFGRDTADQVVPSYEVDQLKAAALDDPDSELPADAADPATGPIPSTTTAYADPTGDPVTTATITAADLATRQADLEAREARLRQAEDAQSALVTQARHAGIAAFADSLVTEGRLLPGERAGLVVALQGLSADAEVEFAETEGATPIKATPLAALQRFLKALPPRVDFSERAGTNTAVQPVDATNAMALADAAKEFQLSESRAGRDVQFVDAVAIVTRAAQEAAR